MSDDGARMQRVGRRVLLEKINFRVCSVRPGEIRLLRHRVNQIAGKFTQNAALANVRLDLRLSRACSEKNRHLATNFRHFASSN